MSHLEGIEKLKEQMRTLVLNQPTSSVVVDELVNEVFSLGRSAGIAESKEMVEKIRGHQDEEHKFHKPDEGCFCPWYTREILQALQSLSEGK